MRSLLLIGFAATAACSGDVGLVLTIDAPDGPGAARRIEIVLASPAPGATETVDDQRIAPGALEGEAVRYYRQKAPAGSVAKVARVDGFVIRIEPRDGADRDEPFVPFVLAYDEADALIGVGAVLDPDGLPAALEVPVGARLEATAAMISLRPADLARGIAIGEAAAISCDGDGGPRRSGLSWRPPTGLEVRLLLPDAGETSAAARPLDLDCDGHDADGDDCDDLRAKYHAGAADTCDGEDTNCRGDRFAVEDCTPQGSACTGGTDQGVRLCADGGGSTPGVCFDTPACRCQLGPCTRCVLAFEGAPPAKVCSPGVGKLKLGACAAPGPCTIEVVAHSPRWEVAVGATNIGPFGRRTVASGEEVFLMAKYIAPALPLPVGSSLGDVHLAVTSGLVTDYVGVDLELANGAIGDCAEQVEVGTTFKMVCSP